MSPTTLNVVVENVGQRAGILCPLFRAVGTFRYQIRKTGIMIGGQPELGGGGDGPQEGDHEREGLVRTFRCQMRRTGPIPRQQLEIDGGGDRPQ